MVKLEVKAEFHASEAFYFHNMKDCEDFMYVFNDHWCNVPWAKPVEAKNFPGISDYARKAMNEDPKQRANKNLSWGFALVCHHRIKDTKKQKAFLSLLTQAT